MADFRNTSCRAQARLNPVLFTTSSSAHEDSAPSQDKWQPWGFHCKSRQNLLWKYWNLLTMGLTCQLNFHCLIYASKEFLGKSFKLQFTSSPHLAQSLLLGKCFVLALSQVSRVDVAEAPKDIPVSCVFAGCLQAGPCQGTELSHCPTGTSHSPSQLPWEPSNRDRRPQLGYSCD